MIKASDIYQLNYLLDCEEASDADFFYAALMIYNERCLAIALSLPIDSPQRAALFAEAANAIPSRFQGFIVEHSEAMRDDPTAKKYGMHG